VGTKIDPYFSPDGKWIAFTADYYGNPDVFVMLATGGEPRRLTSHPSPDYVEGWTPDGKNILFTSTRAKATDPAPITQSETIRDSGID
jgi:tricorn protease